MAEVIARLLAETGQPPTIEELREELGVGSTRTVLRYLQELEEAGVIERWSGARGLRLLRQPSVSDQTIEVPLVGEAPAGALMDAVENRLGSVRIARPRRDREQLYLLRVRGDSMNQADVGGRLIESGDLVLVRRASTADSGDIVVAPFRGWPGDHQAPEAWASHYVVLRAHNPQTRSHADHHRRRGSGSGRRHRCYQARRGGLMGGLKPAQASATAGGLSPVKQISRGIRRPTQLILYGIAAGHCQFQGCRTCLTAHHVDQAPGNYGEKAHIVAFRKKGPRGETIDDVDDINGIENLMLLCAPCHKKIDDNADDYPRELLLTIKRDAEAFVRAAMAQRDDLRTHVITFAAPIHGKPVIISDQRVREALRPRYAASQEFTRIDLNGITVGDTEAFYAAAQEQLVRSVSDLQRHDGPFLRAGHASVFALGPMPLLIKLGALLTDKVDTDFFQRHQEEDWTWKQSGPPIRFEVTLPTAPDAAAPVVVLLSLSGTIGRADLPAEFATSPNIFEMTLGECTSDRTFLRTRDDLAAFRSSWIGLQAEVSRLVGVGAPINLFPAIPAPIAVLCGRARHPKAQGNLIVYDLRRDIGGFHRILEVSHD
ncbi:MAG: SAVED domain-containing protein [Hyphomonas sp.]